VQRKTARRTRFRLLIRILKRIECKRGSVYITRVHHEAMFLMLTRRMKLCFLKREEKKIENEIPYHDHVITSICRKNTCLDAKGVGRVRSAGNSQPTYRLFSLFLSLSLSLSFTLPLSFSFSLPSPALNFLPTEHIKTISRYFIGQFTLHVWCMYHTLARYRNQPCNIWLILL